MSIKRVYIEITNRCNLRCSFCSFHHRELKEMTCAQIDDLLTQIKPHTPFIYLHVQGEPLLHPMFEEIMNLCDQHEMKVQLVTNGTFLHKYPQLANHPSLRKISFSLHSLDFQTCNIQDYMKDIFAFIKQINRPDCFVELRFWTKDHLSDNAQLAYTMIKDNFPMIETKKPNSYQLQPNVFMHFENQFEWPANAKMPSTVHGTCRGVKDMIAILVDGTIVPCCLDAEGDINLGNIFESPLDSILESDRLQHMVKGFNDNQLIEPLCQRCTYRNRFN